MTRSPGVAGRGFRPACAALRIHTGAVFTTSAAIFVLLYLYLLRNVGMANDEWTWLLYRMTSVGRFGSWQTIVLPYNNQPIVGEILLYRLWVHTVGITRHWILDLLFVCLQVGVAALVYTMARRRVGPWPALACALLVLVMGRAWETLLFPATLSFVLPALGACAAWVILDRHRSALTWVVVCPLIGVASVSGGLGLAIAAGVGVEVVLARYWRGLWLVASGAIPLIVWYLAERGAIAVDVGRNLRHIPLWAGNYLAAATGAVVGVGAAAGVVVLVLASAGIGLWRRLSALSSSGWTPRGAGLLTTLCVAVIVSGAARAADTPATSSRYLYFPAIVMILFACEWTTSLRIGRPRLAAAVGAAIVLLAAILGARQFRDGKVFYWNAADGTAARLGAMRLVDGPQWLVEPSGLAYGPVVLKRFIRAFGSGPMYTQAQIARALPASRAAVDGLLASAEVRPGGSPHSCRPAPHGGAIPPAGATVIIASSHPHIAHLVRFAAFGSGVDIPALVPRIVFRVRGDTITTPWRLLAQGSHVRICR